MPIVTGTAKSLVVELPADVDPSFFESRGQWEALEEAERRETRAWRVAAPGDIHPWDAAHRAVRDRVVFEEAAPVLFAEPDWEQSFPYRREGEGEGVEAVRDCSVKRPSSEWPPTDVAFGWHLGDDYSGLRRARQRVSEEASRRVRVGILDTGYDPRHATLPLGLNLNLAYNFVDPTRPKDATDPAAGLGLESRGNPGHGAATLALLAGRQIRPPGFDFDDFLGGCPRAEIVPIRIADSVIHFATSAMARGIAYAASNGCDVVSISMGGVPARSWARAVNDAYERGTVVVAAAGNNIGGLPITSLVYPARFHRVVAVCGATARKEPYYKRVGYRGMQGNFGPERRMATALAAYTPNMPWAEITCGDVVSLDGAGTSSATPQVAAAAALWLALHDPRPPERWQRAEAARRALFASADGSQTAFKAQFGNGLLRAAMALDVPARLDLAKQPVDGASFPWIRAWVGLEVAESAGAAEEMIELEALQLFLVSPEAQQAAGGADPEEELDGARIDRVVKILAARPDASESFKRWVTNRGRTA